VFLAPLFLFVMSEVMWIVTNHEEKQADILFRANSFRLFVMSDVMFIVMFLCRIVMLCCFAHFCFLPTTDVMLRCV
jgi:hypothetical protein